MFRESGVNNRYLSDRNKMKIVKITSDKQILFFWSTVKIYLSH
jgi:hypothetical protein